MRTRHFWGVLVVGLASLALSAPGFAGDGGSNGNGGTPPGQGGTPPGQEQKAEPAQPAAQPARPAIPAAKAAQPAKKAAAHAATADRHAKRAAAHEQRAAHRPARTEPAQTASASPGKSAEAQHHVLVCHRTGSDTDPYVVINISVRGWRNGHSKHDGDRLLKDPATPGEQGFDKSACGPAAAGAAAAATATQTASTSQGVQSQSACPQTTATTVQNTVLVGVWHHTGSKTNPYVFITPSEHAAHYTGKHEHDIPVYQTVERAATTAVGAGTCASATAGAAAGTTTAATAGAAAAPAAGTVLGAEATVASVPASAVDYPANLQGMPVYVTPTAAAARPAVGGVAGVSATIKRPGKGGVLGTAATPRGGSLPFTGLALLGVAIAGAALLAAGWLRRRRAAAQRLAPCAARPGRAAGGLRAARRPLIRSRTRSVVRACAV